MAEAVLDDVNMTYNYYMAVYSYQDKDKNRLFFRNRSANVMTEKYRGFTYIDIPYDHFDISKEVFFGKSLNYMDSSLC